MVEEWIRSGKLQRHITAAEISSKFSVNFLFCCCSSKQENFFILFSQLCMLFLPAHLLIKCRMTRRMMSQSSRWKIPGSRNILPRFRGHRVFWLWVLLFSAQQNYVPDANSTSAKERTKSLWVLSFIVNAFAATLVVNWSLIMRYFSFLRPMLSLESFLLLPSYKCFFC